MADGIEETLGMTPLKDAIAEEDPKLAEELSEELSEEVEEEEVIKSLGTDVATSENKENFLGIDGVRHDRETDVIHTQAMTAFDQIFKAGENVEPSKSARLFEVAGQFLKISQDASNDKVKRQMDVAKLRVAAQKLETDDGIRGSLEEGKAIMADRNALLKDMIAESKPPMIIEGEVDEIDEPTPEETEEE